MGSCPGVHHLDTNWVGKVVAHLRHEAIISRDTDVPNFINQELYSLVRQISKDIIADFEAEGSVFHSNEFLSSFPYAFLSHNNSERGDRVVAAALAAPHRDEVERAIEAAFSNSAGGTLERYTTIAVEDFLNYIIPRIAGMADADTVFEQYYEFFDSSLFGKECIVTTVAVLENVWDNGLGAVLPPGYSLRYITKFDAMPADNRWSRDRIVPYFEISRAAHPIGRGQPISDAGSYFVFSHSAKMPKSKKLLQSAASLRDEITKKFIFSVRLLKFSAAYSEYRGFRTLGNLCLRMHLMNFPDDRIERGASRELQEHDGQGLRRIIPQLAGKDYSYIALLDTKIDDALRRERQNNDWDSKAALKTAVDQLLDYFQMLEFVMSLVGSEYIALYSAVLSVGTVDPEGKKAREHFDLIKRMFKVRNAVMHGRIHKVLTSNEDKFTPNDVQAFKGIVHKLAQLYVMNGDLRELATQKALGQPVVLKGIYPESTAEMNEMRKKQAHPPTWW